MSTGIGSISRKAATVSAENPTLGWTSTSVVGQQIKGGFQLQPVLGNEPHHLSDPIALPIFGPPALASGSLAWVLSK